MAIEDRLALNRLSFRPMQVSAGKVCIPQTSMADSPCRSAARSSVLDAFINLNFFRSVIRKTESELCGEGKMRAGLMGGLVEKTSISVEVPKCGCAAVRWK